MLAYAALLVGCATTTATPTSPAPPPRCTNTAGVPKPSPRVAKRAVVDAFHVIIGHAFDCFARFKRPGAYLINASVPAGGGLASVCVEGDDADAETARCIEDAARQSLRLPPDDGPYALVYPFVFR